MSNSLWLQGLQHARLPCHSLSPWVYSDSCSLSWWWYLTISSSANSLLFLPSIFPSIRVYSSDLTLHIRWPKCWSFNISPSSEYSGLISFKINWFDLLVVQWTLKSLPQLHNSKALILWGSTVFIVHLPYPYMTTGKKHIFYHKDLCQQSDVSAVWDAV